MPFQNQYFRYAVSFLVTVWPPSHPAPYPPVTNLRSIIPYIHTIHQRARLSPLLPTFGHPPGKDPSLKGIPTADHRTSHRLSSAYLTLGHPPAIPMASLVPTSAGTDNRVTFILPRGEQLGRARYP
ncbi:hypothetical protein M011DRAFT_472700 [Sporormia fimetaria CBS 119925]|uniref:Uncharacterized protein n=1 Tax=Sporormia fimetaria CBS 119925 TaxID=1340428 RepID=A0A6A6UWV6_9PLEO|nr:hypothetical protein M011DRAFT_472700 [Sporormia fimetaria CBS 119925]